MSDYVIGLTGGIASGKTAVSQRFEALGITVADADAAARDAVAIGSDGLADVVDMFGACVLAADGSLDRPAMRRRVFADPDARKRLEGIIHPHVRELLHAACARAESPYAIAAVPLLAVGVLVVLRRARRPVQVYIGEDERSMSRDLSGARRRGARGPKASAQRGLRRPVQSSPSTNRREGSEFPPAPRSRPALARTTADPPLHFHLLRRLGVECKMHW